MKYAQNLMLIVATICFALPAAHSQALEDAQAPGQTTYTFTTIDVPGAQVTSVQGINSIGDVVGYYADVKGGTYHGFLYQNGAFTYFDYEGMSTVPRGINDSGLIIGYAGEVNVVGFTFDGSAFTTIKDHNKSATFAMGMNSAGLIVGGSGTAFATSGFESKLGRYKPVNPPGDWVYVYATGVNKFNQVVGWNEEAGFLYSNAAYKTISYPGSVQTEAWGINDSRQTVGWYTPGGSDAFGFLYANARYKSFGYPGAQGTFPRGINNAGQIVGEYTSDYQQIHGFIASPAQ